MDVARFDWHAVARLGGPIDAEASLTRHYLKGYLAAGPS
jgi:hypothetical protein